MKILKKKKFLKNYYKKSFIVEKKIKKIYNNIKKKGDSYLKKCIKKYDKINKKFIYYIKNKTNIFNKKEIKNIKKFINRIYSFHNFQKKKIGIKSWKKKDYFFKKIGQQCVPINKLLIYVPGGKYSYISSLIMNLIPAKIAGVKKIYISTPAKGIKFLKIISICGLLNIKKIFRIGGAHCIFAFAFGTLKIPKVHKIVGPGNIYVSLAKKKVYGMVGLDSIAGPTEILIISDGFCKIKNIILDIFSQLEHDENSKAFILSYNYLFLKKIKNIVKKNKRFIKKINLIYLKNLTECIKLSNKIAPEHLEYIVNDKKKIKNLKNFGTIFIGEQTCEALGDYCAGTNHVLPTNSNSKFSSPLGVNDFLKISNFLKVNKKKYKKIAINSYYIAKIEGLKYHKKSILHRI